VSRDVSRDRKKTTWSRSRQSTILDFDSQCAFDRCFALARSSRLAETVEMCLRSRDVRKPLVAIILNILSTMFYVLEEIKMAMVSP